MWGHITDEEEEAAVYLCAEFKLRPYCRASLLVLFQSIQSLKARRSTFCLASSCDPAGAWITSGIFNFHQGSLLTVSGAEKPTWSLSLCSTSFGEQKREEMLQIEEGQNGRSGIVTDIRAGRACLFASGHLLHRLLFCRCCLCTYPSLLNNTPETMEGNLLVSCQLGLFGSFKAKPDKWGGCLQIVFWSQLL